MSSCLFVFSERLIKSSSISELENAVKEQEQIINDFNDGPPREINKFEADKMGGACFNVPKLYKELYLRYKKLANE